MASVPARNTVQECCDMQLDSQPLPEMVQTHFYMFVANVKGRWAGNSLISVMSTEFVSETAEYYRAAIEIGAIRVNGQQVSADYILKGHDKITHLVHLHEPECPPIEVIADHGGLVVVNKPSGIPCHPTSRFQKYCVLGALANPDMRCLHRLDLVTSGVLFLAASTCKITLDGARKIYIARVEGFFPDATTVEKKILVLPGRSEISDRGKPASTSFRRICYKNGHSLVECTLNTGRRHQIRVHLKSIGFPVLRDLLYGADIRVERQYESCETAPEGLDDVEQFVIRRCKGRDLRYCGDRSFICLHSYKSYLNGVCHTPPCYETA
ncbi:UNVERIFIED_CONTAM: hypothetical protein PYX00_011747 [Menopon gallinae]|uniref:Pseudouridine synthase RsuA/RluA-like domain-containing protein n=1 Tax=Menopon gallinae TaxID=328185 RepID=A0AAW2H8B7_9NEOP